MGTDTKPQSKMVWNLSGSVQRGELKVTNDVGCCHRKGKHTLYALWVDVMTNCSLIRIGLVSGGDRLVKGAAVINIPLTDA